LSERQISCEDTGEKKIPTIVTLKLDQPVTIETEGVMVGQTSETASEYFYNEHTCPTNFLRHVIRIIDAEGDDDPHGIFQFVSEKPK